MMIDLNSSGLWISDKPIRRNLKAFLALTRSAKDLPTLGRHFDCEWFQKKKILIITFRLELMFTFS